MGPASGPGSERVGSSRSARPCSRAAKAEKRRAEVWRRPAGRVGRAGRQESRGRALKGRDPNSGREPQPGVGPPAVTQSAERACPASRPPVGGPRTRRRRGGALLSAPGVGPGRGSLGRWRTRLVGGSDRSPGHQGVRPPTGPAFPAAAGQSERLLLVGGPSRPSCSEPLAW